MAMVVVADGLDHPCPSCGRPASIEPEIPPELPSLLSAFRYPFGSGVAVTLLLVLAPLWALVRSVSTSLIQGIGEALLGKGGILLGVAMLALFGGYVAVWLWEVLESSGHGDDAPPATPWPGDYVEFGSAFARFAAALGTAFLPAFALRSLLGTDAPWGGVAAALGLAGVVYYPMALLLVGFSGGLLAGLRLPTALRALKVLGMDYALCGVLVFVTFGLSTAVEFGVRAAWRHVGPWPGLAATIAASFLELTLYAIHMRAVGLLYRAHAKDLGWFR